MVVGSGNLGLVWFTGYDHRLTVEELDELHPGLLSALVDHPGVGLVMVRSSQHGAMAIDNEGVRFLDEDRVEDRDPTLLFGEHTIMSLRREDAMTHAPDILLLSQYDPELGEVAAFEELIGSHGGLGGPQTEPFILHPSSGSWTSPSRSAHRPSTGTSGAGSTRSASNSAGRRPPRLRRPRPRPPSPPRPRASRHGRPRPDDACLTRPAAARTLRATPEGDRV